VIRLTERFDQFPTEQLSKLVDQKFIPVDMWGEAKGEPTTIREVLSQRAREFWDLSVDEQGRPSSWGGTPRHQKVYADCVRQEFEKAIKDNCTIIVASLKQAILDDAIKITTEHINRLISCKR